MSGGGENRAARLWWLLQALQVRNRSVQTYRRTACEGNLRFKVEPTTAALRSLTPSSVVTVIAFNGSESFGK